MTEEARGKIIVEAEVSPAMRELEELGAQISGMRAEADQLAVRAAQTQDSAARETERAARRQQDAIGRVRTSWRSLSLGVGPASIAVTGAIGAIGYATERMVVQSIQDFQRYASEVRQLGSVTGMGAEETSRLIQVFQDFDISANQITQSMRIMRQQGIVPNIDTLADLSDQYNRLAPGLERVNFLQETFGRSGANYALVLEQGSAALRERYRLVESGLVLSQRDLDASEDLRQSVDALQDAWHALSLEFAREVVPHAADVVEAFGILISYNRRLTDVLELHSAEVLDSGVAYRDYRNELIRSAREAGFWVDRAGQLRDTQSHVVDSTYLLTEAQYLLRVRLNEAGQAGEDQIEVIRRIRQGYEALPPDIEAINQQLEEQRLATIAAADAMAYEWDQTRAHFDMVQAGAESGIASYVEYMRVLSDPDLVRIQQAFAEIREAQEQNFITPEQAEAYGTVAGLAYAMQMHDSMLWTDAERNAYIREQFGMTVAQAQEYLAAHPLDLRAQILPLRPEDMGPDLTRLLRPEDMEPINLFDPGNLEAGQTAARNIQDDLNRGITNAQNLSGIVGDPKFANTGKENAGDIAKSLADAAIYAGNIAAALNGIPGTITVNIVETYTGGGAKPGKKAVGGDLGGGWIVAGDAGWEAIDPGGHIYSHSQSEQLMRTGIIPQAARKAAVGSKPRPPKTSIGFTGSKYLSKYVRDSKPSFEGGAATAAVGTTTMGEVAAAQAEAIQDVSAGLQNLAAAMPSAGELLTLSQQASQAQAAAIITSNQGLADRLDTVIALLMRVSTDAGVARATRDAIQQVIS